MKKDDIYILLFRIPLDFAAVVAAWFMAYWLRPYTDLIPGVQYGFGIEKLPLISFYLPFSLISALAYVLLLAMLGRYRFYETFEPVREFFRLLFASFIWGMLIVAWYALFRHELIFSRIMLVHAMGFSLLFSWVMRLILRGVQVLSWKMGGNHKHIILFGKKENTGPIETALQKDYQFDVVGTYFPSEIEQLEHMKIDADELWRCDPKVSQDTAHKLQGICGENHLHFRFVPQEDDLSFARLEMSMIGKTPMLMAIPAAPTAWERVGKRAFDILGATLLLILLSPVFLFCAIGIKIDSRGPVFYKSTRIRDYGKKFTLWKFRSMRIDAEKQKKKLLEKSHRDGPLFKIKDDPRVTKFGKFLRRTSIDEFPNLINVLKGEMSLVGPRPHLPDEVEKYETWQKRVLMMKPGITGLAQISGRSDLPFQEEVRFDVFYLENWSFWLDIKILLKTIVVIFSQKGAD